MYVSDCMDDISFCILLSIFNFNPLYFLENCLFCSSKMKFIMRWHCLSVCLSVRTFERSKGSTFLDSVFTNRHLIPAGQIAFIHPLLQS
jgi:hypothetical protein